MGVSRGPGNIPAGMFPLLGIIVAFILALAYGQVVRVPHPPEPWAVAATLLAYAGVARVAVNLAVRRVLARESASAMPLLRAGALLRAGTLAAYTLALYAFHWPAIVPALGIADWFFVPTLVVFLPFFVLLVVQLVVMHGGEAALGLHDFGLRDYLSFQLRQYLLPVLPVFLVIVVGDLFRLGQDIEWVARFTILYSSYPFLQWITLAVLLFGLYCLIPFLMRLFWRATPMPPGPLRERLDEFSRREGFRAREILVWPTGGNVMNAAVIGVAAPFRYVLVTDALLDTLAPDEVEAVFAHEVGHAKHNHMLLYVLFMIGYTLLAFLVGDWVAEPAKAVFGNEGLLYLVGGLAGFLGWFGILFGFVSRRFEQQADVYGALSTGRVRGGDDDDPARHPFVRALEGLARQMGDVREVTGWRHFSLGDRIEFLHRFLTSEETRRRYRRRMAGLLALFFGLLLAIGGAAASTIPGQLRRGRTEEHALLAQWLRQQGRHEEALREAALAGERARVEGRPAEGTERWSELRLETMRIHDVLREGALPPFERAIGLFQLAQHLLVLGRPADARAALDRAIEIVGPRPELLDLLGIALAAQGHPVGARLALDDALAALPADHPLRAAVEQHRKALDAAR